MKLNPYLQFNGRCKEAFEFYQKCIGGKIDFMMTYGETPAAEHMPAEMRDAIIYARLVSDDAILMGCDAGEMFKEAGGFSNTLRVDTPEEAERIFAALSEKGTVGMPMEE